MNRLCLVPDRWQKFRCTACDLPVRQFYSAREGPLGAEIPASDM